MTQEEIHYDELGRPIDSAKKYHVKVTGGKKPVFKKALWGMFLTLITLGLYRFWFVSDMRKHFWNNTLIDDSPLEYTGRGIQLLIGFLLAIAIFLPLFTLYYIASQYNEKTALIAIFTISIFGLIFGPYALYRSRRYRLRHTFWRGIRFHQDGSAWHYCGMYILWALLTLLSFGLIYPVMAAKLERYRINNTRFGDKNLTSNAVWKDIAKPYYITYFLSIITSGFGLVLMPWFLAASKKIFANKISLGEAKLEANFSTGVYYYGYLIVTGVTIGLSIFIAILAMISAVATTGLDPAALETLDFGGTIAGIILSVLIYGIYFIGLSAVWMTFYDFYAWQIIGDGLSITNPEVLDEIHRGRREDESGLGEGMADALDVGGAFDIGF